MDPKASWRKYMSLVPDNSSVGSGAQTILAGGHLKRRRPHNAEEDEKKNARLKVYAISSNLTCVYMLILCRTEENISESPLLQLPAEIRRLIFERALGGHHVHIEQLPVGTANRYEKKDIKFGQGLWNEICHDPHGEFEAYGKFRDLKMGDEAQRTPFSKTKDGEDSGQGYHVNSWTYRHRDCGREPELHRFNVALEEWKARTSLSLASLRICKVIYKEMRTVPYSENTFLFRNPLTYQAFAALLRREQLQALQHISIPVAVGSAPFSEGRAKLWTAVIFDYKLSDRIRKLKFLDITMELYFPRDAFVNRQNLKPKIEDCIEDVNVSNTKELNQSTTWIKQLAKLSRATPNFRVMVADDPLSMWGLVGSKTAIRDWRIRDLRVWVRERNLKCLTIEQKQALAKEFEDRLDAEARGVAVANNT